MWVGNIIKNIGEDETTLESWALGRDKSTLSKAVLASDISAVGEMGPGSLENVKDRV